MSSQDLEAWISGPALVSLMTGAPKLSRQSSETPSHSHPMFNPRDSTEQWAMRGEESKRRPEPSSLSLQGDVEGLLLGRFSLLRRPAIHDLATPDPATASGALAPSPSLTCALSDDESILRHLSIERQWEPTEVGAEGARLRLFDGAGAVQGAVLEQSLSSLSDQNDLSVGKNHRGSSGGKPEERRGGRHDVIGWFVRKKGAPLPLRPSMRETAATVALRRWLINDLEPNSDHRPHANEQGGLTSPDPSRPGIGTPILLLLLSHTENGASSNIETCNYRLFALDPQVETKRPLLLPVLKPCRLQIVNLGTIPRPQYSSFAPLPPALEEHLTQRPNGPKGKAGGSSQNARKGSSGRSSVLGLLAEQSRQQVELLEDAYQEQLQQLQALAQKVTGERSLVLNEK